MRFFKQRLISLAIIMALASPVLMAGCAARVDTGYRVYDPYGHDYRAWDHDDVIYYQSWETDTHRHHKDFRKRDKRERQEYWDWRHDHDHDRDHH